MDKYITIRCDPKLLKQIKKVAKETDRSISNLCRNFIKKGVEVHNDKKKVC